MIRVAFSAGTLTPKRGNEGVLCDLCGLFGGGAGTQTPAYWGDYGSNGSYGGATRGVGGFAIGNTFVPTLFKIVS